MIRRYMVPLKAVLMLSDGISAFLLFLVLVQFRFEILDGMWTVGILQPIELAVAYGAMWVGALWFVGLYRLRTHWTLRAELIDVLRATLLLLVVGMAALYVLKLSNISRLFVAMLFLAQPVVTIMSRTALRLLLERTRRQGGMVREMLILGTGREAQAFADTVERHRELGLHVFGHLRGPNEEHPAVTRTVLGTIDDIEKVLHASVVDEVAVCLSPNDWGYVEPATRICEEEGKIVRVSIQALGGMLSGGQFEQIGGVPVMTFLYGPDRFLGMLLKRGFDIAISAVALLILSPVILLTAAYIRIADGPAVLFRHQRVGLHGRVFRCLKFRTMIPGAEELQSSVAHLSEVRGPAFKIADDPRVTSVGRRLRRASIDELPQLWNVLRGDMSIVGPRPAPPSEVNLYSVWHRRRLAMRPGLTGLWQITARSDPDFERRVLLDLDYIDRWSLWLDLKIVLRTLPAIVTQQGR
jgi:exopolysaccharide biosynthesis polyprenyl glycosylphosphotransferase